MKQWSCLLALALLASNLVFSASEEKVTFYVQLIRGIDENKPPAPGAQRVGPKLARGLHSVFKWKSYWEINRQEVTMPVGGKTKVVLSKERAVEIDLTRPNKRKVTAISDNKPLASATQSVGKTMTVIGANRDSQTAWFIVVRRDKPSID